MKIRESVTHLSENFPFSSVMHNRYLSHERDVARVETSISLDARVKGLNELYTVQLPNYLNPREYVFRYIFHAGERKFLYNLLPLGQLLGRQTSSPPRLSVQMAPLRSKEGKEKWFGNENPPSFDNARSTYYGIIVNVFRPRLFHLVKFQSSRPIVAAQTVAITGQLSHLRTHSPSFDPAKPLVLRYFRRVIPEHEGKQRETGGEYVRIAPHATLRYSTRPKLVIMMMKIRLPVVDPYHVSIGFNRFAIS